MSLFGDLGDFLTGNDKIRDANRDYQSKNLEAQDMTSDLYGQSRGYFSPLAQYANQYQNVNNSLNSGYYNTPMQQHRPYQDSRQWNPTQTQPGQQYQPPETERFGFDFEKDPGYDFAKQEGMKEVDRSMRARGLAGSTAHQKGIADYVTGLASQQYGSSRDRALREHGSDQNQRLGIAGMGQRGQEFTQGLGFQGSENYQDRMQRGGQFDRTMGLNIWGANLADQRGYEQNMYNRRQQELANRMGLGGVGYNSIGNMANINMGMAGQMGDYMMGGAQMGADSAAARAQGGRQLIGDAFDFAGQMYGGRG